MPIKVCFTAAEMEPLAKVGGLADVAGALPSALLALDLDVRVFLPLHGAMRDQLKEYKKVSAFKIKTLHGQEMVEAYETRVGDITIYLIDGKPVRAAPSVYSADRMMDGRKFIFFSRTIFPLCQRLGWLPNILHANDWHTSIAATEVKTPGLFSSSGESIRSVLTIHNLPFMGAGIETILDDYLVAPIEDPDLPLWGRKIPLPMGISQADHCVAVSPSYAREIQTAEFGCGLESYLSSHHGKLSGIINGIDTLSFDPASDPTLYANFSRNDLEARQLNKVEIQNKLGLPVVESTPLLFFIGRMDRQKGVELIPAALRSLLSQPWQCVFLGTGDPALEESIRLFEAAFPERVRAIIDFDPILARQLYAAADMIMIPSRYEPCGLVQMIAMHYGCVPIARATGGLRDTINNSDSFRTGFLYPDDNSNDLAISIKNAIDAFFQSSYWNEIQSRAMAQDFSWSRSAREYQATYQKLQGR